MDLRKEDIDPERIPQIVRTARFVEAEEGWFFRTREGILLGPYANKFDAELSASLLIAQLAQIDDGTDPAAVIQAFLCDPSNATRHNSRRFPPVDLEAVRRRQQSNNASPIFQKAWSAIVGLTTTYRKPTVSPLTDPDA